MTFTLDLLAPLAVAVALCGPRATTTLLIERRTTDAGIFFDLWPSRGPAPKGKGLHLCNPLKSGAPGRI
jgi:hypothetical protein